jgi:hypothetical protein
MADLAGNACRKVQVYMSVVVSPLALEAVRQIDPLFEIERGINGESVNGDELCVRNERFLNRRYNGPDWRATRQTPRSDVAKEVDYMFRRCSSFNRFLEDGRVCLSNNAAERAVCGIALGRKSRLFSGFDCGGDCAAVM